MADNITTNNTDVTDSLIFLCDEIFDFTTISGVFFILIFIFSVTGNGLLLCVLVLYENLKNVTNLFVLNVACSDLIFTITLPFWAVSYLHQWVFGDFVCKFMTASYYVGLYSSIILLTALTVDRFITVVMHKFPNRVRRQWFAIGACVAAWIISISASVSNAIYAVETTWNDIPICIDESAHVKLGYYLQVSLLFFLPFAIIVFCYSAILKRVLRSPNRKRHRATVVVVLCIVAAFFICWGPYNMMIITDTWYEPIGCKAQERFEMAFSICQILAYSHCCMNPLLYMLSQKLRKHLLYFLTCKNIDEWRNNRKRGSPSGTSVFHNVSVIAQNSAVMLEMHSEKK
ncbi:chemokine XC receptor 1-like [Anabas testudineus]|uniref:G-protein coupled receptors family 1 profile domain-containing protein n=1 Tax=Anabas testudineus TaxID=64144 RepID=A0A7N6C340_ANATE|nr:chemokine XC receptor 1-like [Anabas testudineus]